MKKMTISDGTSRKKPPANRKWSGDSSSAARICAGSVRSRSVSIGRGEDLVPGDDEDEDRRRREARQRERQDHLAKRGQPAAAERHRRLLELVRDAGEDARRDEHRERQRERGVRDRDAEHESSIPSGEGHRERDREDHDRERARADDREPERVGSAEREARQRVAGRRPDREGEDERDRRDVDAALQRVDDARPSGGRSSSSPSRCPREELLRVLVDGVGLEKRRDRDEVDRRRITPRSANAAR